MSRHYPRAIAMMIGTIVGVGIFGLPYLFVRSGFAVGMAHLAVLTGVVLLIHLWFGEIALRTQAHHRLVGYAGIYLGRWGRWVAACAGILGATGALLAYIIVGGEFLAELLTPAIGGTPWHYSIALALLAGLAIARGLRLVEEAEFVLTAFLFLAVALIAIVGVQRVDAANFSGMVSGGALLPYGAVLFALGGASAIAEIRDTLRGRERFLARAITWGTIFAALVTAAFVAIVVGVSGPATSSEAIAGLSSVLGRSIVVLGALLGILAIATSFLTLGLYLTEVYRYDFRMPRAAALLASVGAPLLIFLLGQPSFTNVILITGAIFGGLDGLLIALIVLRARTRGDRQPEFALRTPAVLHWLVALLFVVGIAVTVREVMR